MVDLESLPDASRLDLSRYREETRAALYRLAVAAQWSKWTEIDEYEIPTFSPDEAELTIHYWRGRWFVTWDNLDSPTWAPIEESKPLLRIEACPSLPLGLRFSPC